jgi:hypothetical protein
VPIKPGDTIIEPLDVERMPALPFWQAVTQILKQRVRRCGGAALVPLTLLQRLTVWWVLDRFSL